MYLSLVLLPFIGSLMVALRGRTMGFMGAGAITTGCIIASCVLSWVALYEVVLCRSPITVTVFDWVNIEAFNLTWAFSFDDLTVIMCVVVLTVSSMVHLYSIDYMVGDPHGQRFMSLLSFFTASMILLVTGNSLGIMFAGWELIGVSSFLLIGFWLTRVQAIKSAVKAITINRVGDMFLTIGLIMAFTVFGSLDYATMFATTSYVNETAMVAMTIMMLIGGMAKSAQVPLHSWLAAAMEGPTPVSALIHAATLVTAGVYLMLRVAPILEYANTTLMVMAFVGAVTAIFAATSGTVQNDIKRVIAYSTCSQIGYLFMSLGIGQYNLAIYHLANHACFKALLFIAAGAIIHAFADQQDMRRYGGLVNILPFVYVSLLIGSLSLMAIPYLTGWYSKDGILEMAIGSYTINGSVVYTIGTIVAGLTAFYSIRLVVLTFYMPSSSNYSSYVNAHESSIYVIIPLVVLSLFAIALGYVSSDLYRGMGTDFLSTSSPMNLVVTVDAEFGVSTLYKLMPFIATVVGSVLSYYMYMNMHSFMAYILSNDLVLAVYRFLNYQWNWDSGVIRWFIVPGLMLGHNISKVIDRGILETVGPYGLQQTMLGTGDNVAYYNTGVITDYAMYIVLGLLSFMTLLYVLFTYNTDYSSINMFIMMVCINLASLTVSLGSKSTT